MLFRSDSCNIISVSLRFDPTHSGPPSGTRYGSSRYRPAPRGAAGRYRRRAERRAAPQNLARILMFGSQHRCSEQGAAAEHQIAPLLAIAVFLVATHGVLPQAHVDGPRTIDAKLLSGRRASELKIVAELYETLPTVLSQRASKIPVGFRPEQRGTVRVSSLSRGGKSPSDGSVRRNRLPGRSRPGVGGSAASKPLLARSAVP
jgi:hypothetical protein